MSTGIGMWNQENPHCHISPNEFHDSLVLFTEEEYYIYRGVHPEEEDGIEISTIEGSFIGCTMDDFVRKLIRVPL